VQEWRGTTCRSELAIPSIAQPVSRADVDRLGVGALRWLVAALLVAGLPLATEVPLDRRLIYGYVVAFAWVPATGFLQAIRRRRTGWLLACMAAVVDVAPFLVALWLLPSLQPFVVPVLIVLVWLWGNESSVEALVLTGVVVSAAFVAAAAGVGGPVLATPAHAVALVAVLATAIWVSRAAAAHRGVAESEATRMAQRSGALLTGVAESIVITTPGGRIREWNSAAERTFGIARTDARGSHCHEMLAMRHGLKQLDCAEGCALLAMAERSGDEQFEVWRELGRERRQPLLVHVAPIRSGPGGQVVDVVHSLRDVSRIKAADEAKTMFLATASHELKTPLTVIEGFAEILKREDPSSPTFQTALETVAARAGELRRHVERLLLTSRIESGQVNVVLQALQVFDLVEERSRHMTGAQGRELILRADGPLPPARAEQYALETVIEHLIDNAVKYSPDGGPVEVGFAYDDRSVHIAVKDRGLGMTPEEVDHCFDRFWQADSSDSRRFGGSGIGLYVVRSLVDAMGGAITVDSHVGEGSTFTVSLLRADVPLADDDGTEAVTERAPEPSIIREFMRQVGVASTLGGPG
jgi:PAS domain S-box-containing protein